jgi:Transposase DDE domain
MDGNTRKPEIHARDVKGLKYFKVLKGLLARLHGVGSGRDKANNRLLHMDQYCTLILLWLYSPIVNSLRGLQQASALKKVQQKFGIHRASLGSLSESVRIFDPEPLKQIARELGDQLPSVQRRRISRGDEKARLDQLSAAGKTITAVDGTIVQVLARIASLAWIRIGEGTPTCGYRLHTQFEILKGLPHRIDVTSANPAGPADERAVLQRTLEPDRLYVMDRGYQKWELWNAIVDKKSSYLCRVRDKISWEAIEPKTLTDADRQAGVLSDQIIRIARSGSRVDHPVRLVIIQGKPHVSRGRRDGRKLSSTGPGSDGSIRLVTDMLDVPAELLASIYSYRWLIELFFKMFKHLLGCRHLLSTKQEGVEIQVYSAIIACMLILLYTGRTPTRRTFEMICFYMIGWASLEELEAHIEKLKS